VSVVSIDEAKAWLNMDGTDAARDAKLQDVIDAAEAVIANRCGGLGRTATTSRVRGGGSPALILPTCPVAELLAVTDSNGTATAVADLFLDVDAGVVSRNDDRAFGASYYDITYLAGRTTVPADLLQAIEELVRHLWTPQRGGAARRPGSVDSESANNKLPGAGYLLPFRVQELIAAHERPGGA
jgi:hypothetical protein